MCSYLPEIFKERKKYYAAVLFLFKKFWNNICTNVSKSPTGKYFETSYEKRYIK